MLFLMEKMSCPLYTSCKYIHKWGIILRRKLQVFISSTYSDLIEERQAAVQAVLNAGHIPAGMELFKAGDQSQKETIKRWIDESDIYLLILGGRYGTMDPDSGKSYTHWEYDYAGESGKPRFAIVIDDAALADKAKGQEDKVLEQAHKKEYEAFKASVTSKICRFYTDLNTIKLAIAEKMPEFDTDTSLYGWVSGRDVPDVKALVQMVDDSNRQLTELKNGNLPQNYLFNSFQYEDIRDVLEANKFEVWNCAEYLLEKKAQLIRGVTLSDGAVYRFASELAIYGLTEEKSIYYRLTKEGIWFIGKYRIEKVKEQQRLSKGV